MTSAGLGESESLGKGIRKSPVSDSQGRKTTSREEPQRFRLRKGKAAGSQASSNTEPKSQRLAVLEQRDCRGLKDMERQKGRQVFLSSPRGKVGWVVFSNRQMWSFLSYQFLLPFPQVSSGLNHPHPQSGCPTLV